MLTYGNGVSWLRTGIYNIASSASYLTIAGGGDYAVTPTLNAVRRALAIEP